MLSSQFWPMPSMSRGVINCAKKFLSHPLSQIKWVDQWEVDLDPVLIPGTCVQYPGLQGGGALGDASTPGTPASSIAASAHGGTYSHVAVAGGAWGGERGAAAATAVVAARRCRATPTGGAVTPPRSAPPHGGRGGRHGARAGGWDRPRATGRHCPRRSMASEHCLQLRSFSATYLYSLLASSRPFY